MHPLHASSYPGFPYTPPPLSPSPFYVGKVQECAKTVSLMAALWRGACRPLHWNNHGNWFSMSGRKSTSMSLCELVNANRRLNAPTLRRPVCLPKCPRGSCEVSHSSFLFLFFKQNVYGLPPPGICHLVTFCGSLPIREEKETNNLPHTQSVCYKGKENICNSIFRYAHNRSKITKAKGFCVVFVFCIDPSDIFRIITSR